MYVYTYMQLFICTMNIYIQKDLQKWNVLGAEGQKSNLLFQFGFGLWTTIMILISKIIWKKDTKS